MQVRRLAALERSGEGPILRTSCLGEDRHGHRYWWLGADLVKAGADEPGLVLVEQVPAPGFKCVHSSQNMSACLFVIYRLCVWGG